MLGSTDRNTLEAMEEGQATHLSIHLFTSIIKNNGEEDMNTYTATLYAQDQALSNRSGSDLNLLTAYLLNQIQEISSGTSGVIMDQYGRIVRRCRKTAAVS